MRNIQSVFCLMKINVTRRLKNERRANPGNSIVARVIGAQFAALADHCTPSLGNSVKVRVDELAPTPPPGGAAGAADQSRRGSSPAIGPRVGIVVSDLQLQNTLNSIARVLCFPSSLQVVAIFTIHRRPRREEPS
ncbi:hypothetical protein GWI33_021567 [Rhynchophorus ferrugineus]|uniref:Uncharacterized protein n=1 Tax=Rhynchophorus ferrugineus TaxID=354439 RepID=A0A834IR57_RHYFE|nr:hypothetical protein GWI33_021567 [Rhynchophorus ferrugineus]